MLFSVRFEDAPIGAFERTVEDVLDPAKRLS
jgi:hypothetical protein